MVHFYKTLHFVSSLAGDDWVPFVSLRHCKLAVFLFYSPMDGVFLSPRLLTGLRL